MYAEAPPDTSRAVHAKHVLNLCISFTSDSAVQSLTRAANACPSNVNPRDDKLPTWGSTTNAAKK